MEIKELVKLVADNGIGVGSFAALMFFGYKLTSSMGVFLTNHLVHLQDTFEEISSKLDKVIENTYEKKR